MRCSWIAGALLIYALTATVLELYWMTRTTKVVTVIAATTAASESSDLPHLPHLDPLLNLVPPPTPPPPPPSMSPPPSIAATRPVGRRGKHNSIGRDARPATGGGAGAVTPQRFEPSSATRAGGRCWPVPRPFFEPPFDEALASVVWSKPMPTKHGPLEDIPASERARDWCRQPSPLAPLPLRFALRPNLGGPAKAAPGPDRRQLKAAVPYRSSEHRARHLGAVLHTSSHCGCRPASSHCSAVATHWRQPHLAPAELAVRGAR